MNCGLSAAECFRKNIAANLDVTERAKGWWSMRCPIGHHGQPLRLHIGDVAHITYSDLGHCPESEILAWLVENGVPAGCLKRPKDQPGSWGQASVRQRGREACRCHPRRRVRGRDRD